MQGRFDMMEYWSHLNDLYYTYYPQIYYKSTSLNCYIGVFDFFVKCIHMYWSTITDALKELQFSKSLELIFGV